MIIKYLIEVHNLLEEVTFVNVRLGRFFPGTSYQNWAKFNKCRQNIPNGQETYEMVVKYSEWPQNTYSLQHRFFPKALHNMPNIWFLACIFKSFKSSDRNTLLQILPYRRDQAACTYWTSKINH
jgi:hypothetical protein